jgi:hypothetical protein
MHWRFQSPTGNIACDLTNLNVKAQVICEVREHTYQPQPRSNCDPTEVDAFTLVQGNAVSPSCDATSQFPPQLPVQGYGRPLAVGAISCVIDENTGVTCTDATSGHFFRASPDSYKWR